MKKAHRPEKRHVAEPEIVGHPWSDSPSGPLPGVRRTTCPGTATERRRNRRPRNNKVPRLPFNRLTTPGRSELLVKRPGGTYLDSRMVQDE